MKKSLKTTLAWLTDALRVDHEFDLPMDLDPDIHEGFTIGKGKTMYWNYTISEPLGNFTVYSIDNKVPRRCNPDQEITVHYLNDK